MTFDEWFLSINNPPYGAIYDLAKRAWDVAQEVEREAILNLSSEPWCLTRTDLEDSIRARGRK